MDGAVNNNSIILEVVGELGYEGQDWQISRDSYVDVTVLAWLDTDQDNVVLFGNSGIFNGCYLVPVNIGLGEINTMQAAIGGFSFAYGNIKNGNDMQVIIVGAGCAKTGSRGFISSMVDVRSNLERQPGSDRAVAAPSAVFATG